VAGWYEAGHPGLTQYIHDLGGGFSRQIALATYLRAAIAKEGPQAVMDWAASVPDDDDEGYKLTVFRQVAAALALLDHEAAMRWCSAHCDGPYGNNLRSMIAGRWVEDDGPSAMEWLTTAPDGHERDLTIMTTLGVWGREDRDAALAWTAQQIDEDGEPPAWLKPALPVYARLLAEQSMLAAESPVVALEWAQRIEKPIQRDFSLITIARKWRERDEAAADAWLEQSPLSEEARAKVRDPNWTPSQR
jgi:hypothetical protein